MVSDVKSAAQLATIVADTLITGAAAQTGATFCFIVAIDDFPVTLMAIVNHLITPSFFNTFSAIA